MRKPREILNIEQADADGCDIITVTNDALITLKLLGKHLTKVSVDTIIMFYKDGSITGYTT